jgi:Flp pilus assembly protein TadG
MDKNRRPIANRFRRRQTRRGATVVEFAIVAPVFFLFLLAAFEFGWFNVMRHTADNAAYEAARHAMVPGATAAEARDKANSILNIVGTRGANVRVTPAIVTPDTEEITVTIDVPMNRNALILPRFMRNKTIRAASTLRTERAE